MDGKVTWYETGRTYKFYGAESNCFKLDDRVLRAVEDEDDGYRSYLETVEVVDTTNLIFFKEPLDTVTVVAVVDSTGIDGYILRAADGHCWLSFGTENWDDYYPYFVFDYTPRGE